MNFQPPEGDEELVEQIKVGAFTVYRFNQDSFFIRRDCGEGMEIKEVDLELLLIAHYDEHF